MLGAPKRCLIFGVELRRAIFGADAHLGASAYAHIPGDFAVAGNLPLQMRRARAGHVVYHRTISPGGSSGLSAPVDDFKRITIDDCSPMRTSTSAAPVCLAARIARATSAWVMAAGRRGITTPLSSRAAMS